MHLALPIPELHKENVDLIHVLITRITSMTFMASAINALQTTLPGGPTMLKSEDIRSVLTVSQLYVERDSKELKKVPAKTAPCTKGLYQA